MQHTRWLMSLLVMGLMMSGGLLLSSVGLASADGTGPVDIAVSKSVDNPAPEAGDTIIYTITATNRGTGAATNLQIIDHLPGGVTLSASGAASQGNLDISALPTVLWTVGDLAPQGSATLDITVTVDSDTQGNTITNTAMLSTVGGIDSDNSNNSSSVSITIQGSATPIEPEEGKRHGFVGTVQGAAGEEVSSPLTLILQGAGESVEIVLPDKYDLKTPGGPRAGELVNGAEVAILARWDNGQWVAERVLVKPVRPLPPVNGVVVNVEAGAFTIETPNGATQTIQVPSGAPVFTNGEMVTIFLNDPLPDEKGEGKAVQATGLVRAAQVGARLQKHLDRLTAEDSDLSNGIAEAEGGHIERLIELLEDHDARHLAGLEKALERASAKERAAILRAKEKAERARERAEAKIQEAREKAERQENNGNPAQRRDVPPGGQESDHPGQGNGGDDPGQGKGPDQSSGPGPGNGAGRGG